YEEVGAVQGLGRVRGGVHRVGQGDPGQVLGILVVAVDPVDHLGAPPAQHGVGARVGQHEGEGGAPVAGAEDGGSGHALASGSAEGTAAAGADGAEAADETGSAAAGVSGAGSACTGLGWASGSKRTAGG